MNPLNNFVVILYRLEDSINLATVVRAMKNMGISDLRLVQPVPYTRDEVLRVAHHTEDILDRIEVHTDLDSALEDALFVLGTTDTTHPGRAWTQDVRALAPDLIAQATQGRVALLFGPEADGLDRYAMDRCHLLATLPVNPAYPALNLAQSVLLMLYELRLAAIAAPLGSGHPEALPPSPHAAHVATQSARLATQDELERLFRLTEEALAAVEFFRYNPAAVMVKLRQIAFRARLTSDDVSIFLAISRRVLRMARRA